MGDVILLGCFFSIFLAVGVFTRLQTGLGEILLQTALLFSALVTVLTELLSWLRLLGYTGILVAWTAVFFLMIVLLGFHKKKLFVFINTSIDRCKSFFARQRKRDKLLIVALIAMLFMIFVQSLLYPPNNWDAMAYHLARIPHWIDHHSVEHYPTHIFRQIYQPPFAEYVILHLNVLSHSDFLSNTVQFFFLIFSIPAVVGLTKMIGLPGRFNLWATALLITIPEVALQASSTQNDIVLSFFVLAAIYYSIKSIREPIPLYFFLFGLSSGLALLTKGTGYLYMAPVFLIYGGVVTNLLLKTKMPRRLIYSVFAALICLCVNLPLFVRNHSLNGNFLGLDSVESRKYATEKKGPIFFLSSMIKNAGIHMGPFPINKISNYVIRKAHEKAGIDIDDPATNFNSKPYSGAMNFSSNENITSNAIHFYLIVLSFFIIGVHFLRRTAPYNTRVGYLSAVIILQAIFFCFYLKWQPWNTRLQTPMFVLSVPLICYASSYKKIFRDLLQIAMIAAIFYSFFIIICNNTRPLWTNRYTVDIHLRDNTFKKYFADRLNVYEEYDSIDKKINQANFSTIGLILGEDDYEYPLFNKAFSKHLDPVHILVTNNISKNIPQQVPRLDCIVSTTRNDSLIQFKGSRYINQNRNNKNIWLYLCN